VEIVTKECTSLVRFVAQQSDIAKPQAMAIVACFLHSCHKPVTENCTIWSMISGNSTVDKVFHYMPNLYAGISGSLKNVLRLEMLDKVTFAYRKMLTTLLYRGRTS
jgi:hypothetical protein